MIVFVKWKKWHSFLNTKDKSQLLAGFSILQFREVASSSTDLPTLSTASQVSLAM